MSERVPKGWQVVKRRLTSTPGAIFGFFACLYTLTAQARTNTYDGMSMFATTQALGDHASLAIANISLGVPGRFGLHYSKYGIGPSLAELPLYLVGKALGLLARSRGAQVAEALAMLTNPLLMALCVAVLYGVTRELGYGRRTAVAAAFVLGIATSLWPYAKSDFSEPLLALCLALATLCALREARQITARSVVPRLDVLCGCALAGAVLAKYAAIAFVPVFALYLSATLPHPRSAGL